MFLRLTNTSGNEFYLNLAHVTFFRVMTKEEDGEQLQAKVFVTASKEYWYLSDESTKRFLDAFRNCTVKDFQLKTTYEVEQSE